MPTAKGYSHDDRRHDGQQLEQVHLFADLFLMALGLLERPLA
jgi:hypothetical protein